jgi:hypothetical protein
LPALTTPRWLYRRAAFHLSLYLSVKSDVTQMGAKFLARSGVFIYGHVVNPAYSLFKRFKFRIPHRRMEISKLMLP